MPKQAVMISIRPEWCSVISQGKKTVEVRKTRPKQGVPFKCYIYCTKGMEKNKAYSFKTWNAQGKVMGEFVCDAIFPICIEYSDPDCEIAKHEFAFTGLTDKQIIDYLGNGKDGYGWHISDLVIYDKPKQLSEFYKKCKSYDKDEWDIDNLDCIECKNPCGNGGKLYLKRPPQSWCYVEERRPCSE